MWGTSPASATVEEGEEEGIVAFLLVRCWGDAMYVPNGPLLPPNAPPPLILAGRVESDFCRGWFVVVG